MESYLVLGYCQQWESVAKVRSSYSVGSESAVTISISRIVHNKDYIRIKWKIRCWV